MKVKSIEEEAVLGCYNLLYISLNGMWHFEQQLMVGYITTRGF